VKVQDRDDVDALQHDAIRQAVGKLGNEQTPELATKRRARRREAAETNSVWASG
jgi:hypothetical protein